MLGINGWQILNGRVIFVDTAKARPRFNDAVPIASGPPKSQDSKD